MARPIARTMLTLMASVLAVPVCAQSPQSQNASFEAALKQVCPAKNLEFLKPDVLARETDAFVSGLPQDQSKRVRDLAKPGVDACAGSADDSCRTAAVLGSIRYLDLSLPLAQRFCALPMTCRDWFDCSTETAAAQSAAPAPPAAPAPTPAPQEQVSQAPPPAPQPQPRPESPPPRQAEAAAPESPPPARQAERPVEPRRELGQREAAGEGVEPLPQETPAQARPEPRGAEPDGRAVVERFYGALGRGDGIDAAHYLIPEKRGRGPFSAAAMQRFYGGLRRPLRLEAVRQIGPSTVRARYDFVARDGSRCNGDAIVALRPGPDGPLIESIRALSGC